MVTLSFKNFLRYGVPPVLITMAEHFAFTSSVSEVAPYNAVYGWPTQATKAYKTTVKITPREAGPFYPGNVIRLDLPAQDYLNPLNSTLRFKVQVKTTGTVDLKPRNCVRAAKNGNSFFSRLRLLYGTLVIEDIQDYNILVRMLTNVSVAEDYCEYAGAVYEGLGSELSRSQNQSSSYFLNSAGKTTNSIDDSVGVYFQINLASGLLTQKKLLPLKWMASQLRIELYVAPAHQVFIIGNPSVTTAISPWSSVDSMTPFTDQTTYGPDILMVQGSYEDTHNTDDTSDDTLVAGNVKAIASQIVQNGVYPGVDFSTGAPNATDPYGNVGRLKSDTFKLTYRITNVEYVMEQSSFSDAYDQALYAAMADPGNGGLPIHFASWHTFLYAITGQNAQYPVHERSKSIKAAFAVITSNALNSESSPYSYLFDSFAFTRLGLQKYIWRVGSRYYPNQDVNTYGSGGEAFVELQKALNMLGQYEAGCEIHPWLYGCPTSAESSNEGQFFATGLMEPLELAFTIPSTAPNNYPSIPAATAPEYRGHIDYPLGKHYPWVTFATGTRPKELIGGACSSFVIGTSFQSSNGEGMSGINGEEQNEILLRVTHNKPALDELGSLGGCTLYIFTYYDAVMVVRPNNVVDLIS